jgi:NitT/TauT family transport system ATP-binding protein
LVEILGAEMKDLKKQAQIQVRRLRVRYDGNEILHGVDLNVERGEFVSIVGQSGSGKSTLLHALAGFIDSEGEARMPKGIGMVFQNYAVYPWLTVRGNIAFGLHGINRQKRERIIDTHLELVGLEEQENKYPAQLSGGQTQRVALARALAPNPEVIFMDEPFGALDMYTREKMQTWLLEVWEKDHKTVLFVTHNIEEAIFLSDRIIVIGDGKILGEFPSPFERPRTELLKFTPPFVELKRQILELIEQDFL